MATANGGTRRSFTATIARANGHGFQIAERPGVWLNLSKFDDPQPGIPPAGTAVGITTDGAGYVRAIEPSDPGEAPQPPLPLLAPPSATRTMTNITRLAVLKAAARFLASKPEATSDQVLDVASAWVRWIDGAGA
jgi:hypothetical protein